MPKAKDKLIFITHYLGSLRYFEKLIPYLTSKYEVVFLFMPQVHKDFKTEMIAYCQRKNYPYIAMKPFGDKKIGHFLPFLNPLSELANLKRETKKVLTDATIKKIVSVFDGGLYNYFLKNGQQQNIETFVLQWAATNRQELTERKIQPKIHQVGLYLFLVYHLRMFLLKTSLRTSFLGGGSSEKLGAINKYSANFFKEAGVPESKVSIVGYIDFDLAREMKKNIIQNPSLKQQLALKNKVDLNKKNILLYSTLFHKKDIKIFSLQDQLNYYQKIIEIIRQVFPAQTVDILFKIHPAGYASLYESLKKYGVKVFGKDAENDELIALSDLYIAHHTTTNFMAILMGIPCIFINLLKMPTIEQTKINFGIKYFIQDEKTLKKRLIDFENNQLERQYDFDPKIFPENCIQKIINWIN